MLQFPNAKINIGLYVTRRRSDGYHDLLTAFYPIPLTDVLEVKELSSSLSADPYHLQVVSKSDIGPAADNLVVRVYEALRDEFALPPTDIYLQKRIPSGAGLGGGSSDAAYMMRMLNEEHRLGLTDDEMEHRLAAFGADCPFFVRSRPTLARGIGNEFSPLSLTLSGMTLVLVKPDVAISTREAYAGITPAAPRYDLAEALSQPVETWRETVSNDFEKSLFPHYPQLPAIKETLYDMGAVYASMSGSGSALYGLFRRPVVEAKDVFSDCFVFQQRLRV